ncbi:MAG: hypothetical protein HYU39_00265 [Thaumarchaeota archaeon]|nr:hypothetical protein [Nitrososphaerota archaeon]
MRDVKKDLSRLVKECIIVNAKCYRHCDESVYFREIVDQEDRLLGAYVCPGNYVSRVVYFSPKVNLDLEWFKKVLRENVPGVKIRDWEIRVATRHPWENAVDMEEPAATDETSLAPFIFRQVYWTPPKVHLGEEPQGPFICTNCGRVFVQSVKESFKACPDCRKTGT